MSRPLTKSPPFTVRLPAELVPYIAAQADAEGKSARRWLEDTFAQALSRKFLKDPS